MFFLTSINIGEKIPAHRLDDCLLRLAENDTDALATLYYEVNEKVYGFALSIVKNPQDAEDVLHDVFTTVYEAASTYRSVGKPMAWILTITRNLCLQKLREGKKTISLPEPTGEETQADITVDHAENTEHKILLEACMKWLSDHERQILVLHAVSGLKHREIAQMMSLSLSTVLSKYHRAIKKLKVILERGDSHA